MDFASRTRGGLAHFVVAEISNGWIFLCPITFFSPYMLVMGVVWVLEA